MKKKLIFDLGNVLLGWEPDLLYSSFFPDEEALADFYGKSDFFKINLEADKSSWKNILPHLAKSHPDYIEYFTAYLERYMETMTGLMEENVAIVDELKSLDFNLYALTNYAADTFELTRKNWPWLDEAFIDILVSGEEGLIKPDSAIFHLALERWQLDASQTIFIDDSKANIDAATQLGIDSIHFTKNTNLRHELKNRGLLT